MFWLSHHYPEEYQRTYAVGRVRVCARCLGTYPIVALAIGLQLAADAPLAHRLDVAACVLLTLPALVDWAVGRFLPLAGSNALRTGTGVALGAALGRSLYVHFHRPFPLALVAQLGVCTAVVALVFLVKWARRSSWWPTR